jgi:hypothetical protein
MIVEVFEWIEMVVYEDYQLKKFNYIYQLICNN